MQRQQQRIPVSEGSLKQLDTRVAQLNAEKTAISTKIDEYMAKTKADAATMSDDDVVATLEVTVVGAKGDLKLEGGGGGDDDDKDEDKEEEEEEEKEGGSGDGPGAECFVSVAVDEAACAAGAPNTARSSALVEGDSDPALAVGRKVTTAYGKGKLVALDGGSGAMQIKTDYGTIYATSEEGVSLVPDELPTAAAIGATHMCNETFAFPVTRFDNKPGANVVVTLARRRTGGGQGQGGKGELEEGEVEEEEEEEAAMEAMETLGEVKMPMKLVDMGGMGSDRPFEEWFRMKPAPTPPKVVRCAYGEGTLTRQGADGSMDIKTPWGIIHARSAEGVGLVGEEKAAAAAEEQPAPAAPADAAAAAEGAEGAAEGGVEATAVVAVAAPAKPEKPKFFALRLRLGLVYAAEEAPRRQRRSMVLMLKRHQMMLDKELAQIRDVRDQIAVLLQQQKARGANGDARAGNEAKLKAAMAQAMAQQGGGGGGGGGGSRAIQSAAQARERALADEDAADEAAQAAEQPGYFARASAYVSAVTATQEFNLAKNAGLFVFGSIGLHFFGDQFVV